MQPGWLESEGGRRTDYILHDMCTNNTNIQHSDCLMEGESGLISGSTEGGDRGGSSSLSVIIVWCHANTPIRCNVPVPSAVMQ